MSDSDPEGGGRVGHRSRRKLDVGTRVEVLRLARHGQGHPQPEVSRKAYGWASDRLQFPLWRDLLWVVAGGLLGLSVVLVVLLALDHRSVGPLVGVFVAIAFIAIVGGCGWTVHMHRRVAEVARLNHS
jgi:hypothetical protein